MEEGTELNLKLGNGVIRDLQGRTARYPHQLRGRNASRNELQRHVLLDKPKWSFSLSKASPLTSIQLGDETVTRTVKEKKAGVFDARCMLGD